MDLHNDDSKRTQANVESLGDDDNMSMSCYSNHGTRISPPITLLQEVCSRNGFTPEYQLLSTEGSVHEPTFKIAVTVNDITVTASGQSKKKARHAAAKEAIERLRHRKDLNFDGINFDSMAPLGEPSSKSSYAIAVNEANPVGKLQEICMKMRVNPPDYDTCHEKGLAHERIFTLSCSIKSLNKVTWGEGRSKKLAKRQAAEKMLAELESSDMYDKSADNPNSNLQNASSLNLDGDDNSNLFRARRLMAELISRLDTSIEDLWRDIRMIETDTVNEDLFHDLFAETLAPSGYRFEFHPITDNIYLLHVLDEHDNKVMTSNGYGTKIHESMKDAVIRAYKLILASMEPLSGTDSHLKSRAVDNMNQTNVPMVVAD